MSALPAERLGAPASASRARSLDAAHAPLRARRNVATGSPPITRRGQAAQRKDERCD